MKKVVKELSHFINVVKPDYPYAFPVTILNAVSEAGVPYMQLFFSAMILNQLLERQYRKALLFAALMIGLTLVLNLIHKISENKQNLYARTLDDSVQLQLNDKAYTKEYDHFERTESMDNIRSAWNFVNGSGGYGTQLGAIKALLASACKVLFSLIILAQLMFGVKNIFRIDDLTLWLLLLGMCAALLSSWIISKHMGKLMEKAMTENVHINSVAGYIVNGIGMNARMKKDMMLFPMIKMLLDYYDYSCSGTSMYLDVRIKDAQGQFVLTVFSYIYIALGYIYVGLKAASGLIPIGNVLMYAGAIQKLTGSLQELLSTYHDFVFRQEYLDPFYQFIHKPPMHYTGTLPIEKRADADYELEFRDVSFAYPGTSDPILKHINLKFSAGQKLALVGRNGAGKSTLIKLLCRLYEPTSGEILLNGISIWKYDYTEYTSIFAPVFQDYKLFSLPIMENINCETEEEAQKVPLLVRFFRGQQKKTPVYHRNSAETEARVKKALDKAGILERVQQMPDGLNTQLYKNNGDGVDISGGEAQKLAIARAWYKDAPFIILDEPTAALDPLSEAEIYENFNSLIENKTAIYISHRMSSCKFCDRIVVLKDGEIVEDGTHESLMELKGEYESLYSAQAEYYK